MAASVPVLKRLGAVVLLALIGASTAHARLAPPQPQAPGNGATVEVLPAFAWSAVSGAERYEFQVSADSGFNAPVLGRGSDHFFTRNTRATLGKTVPNGTYWWRVRAVTKAGGVSAWAGSRSVKKQWSARATLQAPAGGSAISYPATPLRLTWSPVPWAAKYLVSIATDPQLGSLVPTGTTPGAAETAATSFTRGAALTPGSYFWSVTPVDAQGNRGASSPVASFTWLWPSTAATRVSDLVAAAEFFDPHFGWDAVPGAARYEVEVNSSQDFAPGSKVCCAGTTINTSLSPSKLFKDNTYYWRVRAIDADGNAGVWNVGPSFTKTFDKSPPVTAPSIKNLHLRDHLGDPGTDESGAAGYQTRVPVVAWDPVPGASSYQVEVTHFSGGICDWSSTDQWRVWTAVPFWTPLADDWNNVKPFPDGRPETVAKDSIGLAAGKYCTRVRARTDRDAGNDEIFGDYTYLDDGTGASFEWLGYPTGDLCEPGCSPGYLGSGDYLLPQAGSTSTRTPLFGWEPLAGANSYFVIVAKDPSFSNVVDYALTRVPAYAPRTATRVTTYSDETTLLYWVVLPATGMDGSGAVGNPLLGAASSFQKRSTPPTLLGPGNGSDVMTQPTFHWTPVEGARRYRVQVAQDASFGEPIDDVVTTATAFASTTSYPADTVFYWRVRADDEALVGLTWSSIGTFQKRLPVPRLAAGNALKGDSLPTWTWDAVVGAVSYDVSVDLPDGSHTDINGLRMPALTPIKMTGTGLFHWRVRANFPKATSGVIPGPYSARSPFTRTISEPTGTRSDRSKHHLLLTWEPKPGAKNYEVQVANRLDFSPSIERVRVDTTSYAPKLLLPAYLEGGALYWRVAAIDEDRNIGDFSPAQKVGIAARMRLRLDRMPVRGRTTTATLIVTSTQRRPLAGVAVKLSGAGVKGRQVRTNAIGKALLRLRPTKRGTLRFTAVKAGYETATLSVRVR